MHTAQQDTIDLATSANLVNDSEVSRPQSYKRERRDEFAILFGGLAWEHERLIECVLPIADACSTRSLGNALESHAISFDGTSLWDFRLSLFARGELSQDSSEGDGLGINMPLSLGIIWGILCADVLVDLEHMTRPYEVNPGQTDRVLNDCVEYLHEVFRNRPHRGMNLGTLAWHVSSNYFTRALREVRRKWDAIEVDRLRVKARVNITGEHSLQPTEAEGNCNIKRWLEQEGGELVSTPAAVWLQHLLHSRIRRIESGTAVSNHARLEELALRAADRIHRGTYASFRHALGDLPNELPDYEDLRNLAAPFDYFRSGGGEGHMRIGMALHAFHHKEAHMTCELSSDSRAPKTTSACSMAGVLEKYPDLLYAPIQVKGGSEAQSFSPCHMVLTEAKKRANAEFEASMKKTGLTVESIREFEERHPELQRATYKVPRRGCAGEAANYVLHLAFDRGLADGPSPIVRRPNLVRAAAGGILSTPTGATRFRRKLSRLEGMPGPTCPQSGGTTQLATHSWHSQPK
jgi:predicted nucleotide-binding protein (sugar kinase/HSP70/actin superfamily)